ncbi:MAG: GAF domain-containing protein [candidate division NC10 bacterium]|nr:GAF domain-containing protein [candidate division NC10 bacterium]
MATFEIDSLLAFYLELIVREVGASSGSLLQLDRETGEVIFKVEGGEGAVEGKICQDPLPPELAAPVVERGEAVLNPSCLTLPLKAAGQVVGLLDLKGKRDGSPFTQADIDLLLPITHQIAIVMENARLLETSQRKVAQLNTLMELSAILNSTLETKEVLRRAMEAIVRLMECEVGSLLLVDEEAQELVFEVALGEKGEQVKEIRLKVGEGIAGWVAKEGQPLVVNDVARDARFYRGADERTGFITKNMACLPVKSKGKIIGVLQAINRLNGRLFGQEDIELFGALANQVAIALENARLFEEVRTTFLSTIETLAEAIERRDPYTGGHVKRVQQYAVAVGEAMGLSPEELEHLRLGAILHDVGKIGIDDAILRKEVGLNEAEYVMMKAHTTIGAELLSRVKQLKPVVPTVRHHQERLDGKGYPDGLKGQEIPLAARIIAAVDTFDAMTTDRPYRKRFPDERALAELQRFAGIQFDPDVVTAFFRAHADGKIRSQPSDGGI